MAAMRSSVIIGLAVWLMVGCSSKADPPSEEDAESTTAREVEVHSVHEATVIDKRRWSGQLQALSVHPVRAAHRGVIQGMEVREGDRVDAGDVIARIAGPAAGDRRAVLSERIDHLRQEWKRWEGLAERGAAGPAEVNEAKLRLLEAEQQRAELEGDFTGAVLRSPVTGWVRSLQLASGTNVSAGDVIAEIADASTMGIELEIADMETAHLAEASTELVVRDQHGQEYSIDRVVFDDAEHPAFVAARLYLDDVDDNRRRRIEVTYEKAQQVVIAPWTAVAVDDDRRWVAAVDADTGAIERRSVELGRAHQDGVEVVDGLRVGDTVMRYEPRSVGDGEVVIGRDR